MADQIKASNITWHASEVSRQDREKKNGHKAAVLWFTGLSGSGKSTVANAVEKALFQQGCQTYVLDGDNVRHGLNKDLSFSPEDRQENIRRIAEVAHLIEDAGLLTLTAFVSPYRADRNKARAIIGDAFMEVHVQCDLAICEQRDPKGLYKKARKGEIQDFTGISAPYEAPEAPEIIVDTGQDSLEKCVKKVIVYLHEKGFISFS
jgi:adenylylsulfate kinase